jgi:molybdopterin converting factor small subunit
LTQEEEEVISVTVKFFADFTKYGPSKAEIQVPNYSKIDLLLDKYHIPKEKTKMIILVNGLPHYTRDYVLKNGDIVAIFPPLAGG